MTDGNSGTNDGPKTSPGKKPRSPVERCIVWGMIVLMTGVIGVEANGRFGHSRTLAALQSTVDEADKSDTGDALFDDFRTNSVTGIASEAVTGEGTADKVVSLQWMSLFKHYEIRVRISTDENPVILDFATPDAPEDEPPASQVVAEEGDPGEDGAPAGGPPMHDSDPTVGTAGAPGGGGPGGGPGGGGSGGGRRRSSRGLLGQLGQEAVQAELELTADQIGKLEDLAESSRPDRAAFEELSALPPEEQAKIREQRRKDSEAAVKEILDGKQFARAMQLALRSTGPEALGRDDVAVQLDLTDEQREKLAGIFSTQQEQRSALFQSGDRSGLREKMTELREKTNASAMAVLTEEQTQAWEKLLGPPGPEAP